jgi:hypothetical protein
LIGGNPESLGFGDYSGRVADVEQSSSDQGHEGTTGMDGAKM